VTHPGFFLLLKELATAALCPQPDLDSVALGFEVMRLGGIHLESTLLVPNLLDLRSGIVAQAKLLASEQVHTLHCATTKSAFDANMGFM
jgi:hypothetical protein